ncbi:autotransporter-associated beta strand repeat-containing protein [Roseimicrobium sp. ORNL1]|uniref:autotransporter-associated beta strand repeat-containing protein n=1 Tax=Roseimicrobium sp. ORNL1 TaxID=2711231 RepID=UPI0013E14D6D|nr:autotransporter-associated beta strand repeat-containing protein [Roseimicrobium sp. ORNL1]QIF04081.1 hypothetical protein G5S37_21975 [Roseimicrobium sp. ORNL1]
MVHGFKAPAFKASGILGQGFLKLAFLQAILAATTTLCAFATEQTATWTSSNGNWNNSNGNAWSPRGVPTSSTSVRFGSSSVSSSTVQATVNGNSVVSAGASIGYSSGKTATVIVQDTGGNAGLWTASGTMTVGDAGTGTLTIRSGGEVKVTTGGANIGQQSDGVGTVTVTGTGSKWNITGGMTIANEGQGSLTISSGGVVTFTDYVKIGVAECATGTVLVTGAGSQWSGSSETIKVGYEGVGQLTIENGGRVLANEVILGKEGSGEGTLNLKGTTGARGVLEVGSILEGEGSGTINFDGGVLKARESGSLFQGFEKGDLQILAGGAYIEVGTGLSTSITTAMEGTGGLTKTGNGTLTLNSSTANTYQGTTAVQEGTLVLARTAADSGTVRNLEVGDGTGAAGSAVVRLDKNEQIKNDASVTIKSDGAFQLNGKTETVGSLVNQGGSFTTGAGKLTAGDSVTFAGGTNTINSGGTVESDHVVISGGTNTVEAGGNLKVLAGGEGLELNNASVTLNSSKGAAGSLTLRGDVTSTGNSSIATAGVGTNAGTVNLDGGTRDFNVVSGQLAVSADITNGGLTKLGTGTMVVSGNSTYAGTTTISEGTLNVTGSLSKTSSVVVADGGTLMLSGTAGSSKVNDAAAVTLQDGSTVAFDAGLTNHTETMGQLTLSGDSIVDFGVGSSNNILRFAISGAIDWTGTLSIYNYQPGHQIYFGTQDSIVSLTQEQLDSITFYSGAGTGLLGTGQWTGNNSGQVVVGSGIGGEIAPVPEPASVMSALLLLGVIGWGERGWLSRRGAVRRRLQTA